MNASSTKTWRCASALGILLSLALHVIDQATDVFAAFLFYFEGRWLSAALTLTFVFLPGVCIGLFEFRRMCSGKSNVFKALGYLLFAPLWAIVIHLYSLCDRRYVRSALFFKTMEAFLEAAPQILLQLGLIFRGRFSYSSALVLDGYFNVNDLDNAQDFLVLDEENATINGTMEVFDRYYDEEGQYYFGWVHIASVVFSFISLFVSTLVFNDIEDDPLVSAGGFVAKLCIAVPYYLFTLLFRAISISLIVCFMKWWGGILIFGLFFWNVLSALSIGDTYGRALSYGLWSLLVPVGYNRDPGAHLGYTKVPLHEALMEEESVGESVTAMTDQDIERSARRARYFLTLHVLSSIFIVGSALVLCIILVQTYPEYYELNTKASFDLSLLNTVFLPFLGLCLGFSVILVRPYHRCECSGGESKRGNAIV